MRVTITIDLPGKPEPNDTERKQMNAFLHNPIRDFAARFHSKRLTPPEQTWGHMKPFGATISYEPDPPKGATE